VGLLNPTLYAHASAFHDVTSGTNGCCGGADPTNVVCCSRGFSAAPGWDAVTGLGSITYTALEAMFT
jgi:tripeptidyl-peptidase-1